MTTVSDTDTEEEGDNNVTSDVLCNTTIIGSAIDQLQLSCDRRESGEGVSVARKPTRGGVASPRGDPLPPSPSTPFFTL